MKWVLVVLWRISAVVSDDVDYDVYKVAASASGSSRVGERCSTNTDCVQGALCDGSLCKCWGTHVPLERYCWKKISPEESGCTYDEQCEAVWPGSKCQFSICKCPSNMKVARTREGSVCHPPGHCPLNGANSMLFNRNTHEQAQCFFFDGESRGVGSFIGCDDFPEVHDCIDGLCCPTRALTCILPMDTGTGSSQSSVSRWYFNSISDSCQEFQFTAEGGNANNFLTEQHCSSYCQSRCRRGQPQLEDQRAVSCATDQTVCDQERYFCHRDGHTASCCPKPEFVCSEWGGVSSDAVNVVAPPKPISFSSGSNKFGVSPLTRWYWDKEAKSCKPFQYYGQGGNFNNFLTEEHCHSFCAKILCQLGSPLREASGRNLACSSQTKCPRTHHCYDGLCCPNPVTVCNQPLIEGIFCSDSPSSRWWFNPSQGICQEFNFKGCQGNTNNFHSAEECHRHCGDVEAEPRCTHGKALQLENGRFWRCGQKTEGGCPANYECIFDGEIYGCCPTKIYACSLPSDNGRACGPGATMRWYFDGASRSCRSFSYLGCDGNANNFPSQRECQDHCHAPICPDGGSGLLTPSGGLVTCDLDKNPCPETHSCTRTISLNRSLICCATRKTICSEEAEEGERCSAPVRRYHFEPATKSCTSFSFTGCGGNTNNFPSRAACFNFCHSAACARSELVYYSGSEAMDCTYRSCPRGYSCVKDLWNESKSVCCGAPNFGVCPSNERPFLDVRTQQPLQCSVGQRNDCPDGFHCLFNTDRNTFFCCGDSSRVESCPEGARLQRSKTTGDPVGCNSDSQCGAGAGCHQPDPLRSGVCCRNMDNICPPTFTYDQKLSEESECSPLERNSCDSDLQSVCLFSEKKGRFVCCHRGEKPIVAIDKCPIGSFPDEPRVFCSVSRGCPPTHFCMRRDSDRVGLCCKHPKLGRERPTPATRTTKAFKYSCPDYGRSVMDSHGIHICDVNNPCPPFYNCLTSVEDNSISICCSHGPQVCRQGTFALTFENSLYSCKMKNCPPGYSCDANACCPTRNLACMEPAFLGTVCENRKGAATRFYFDAATLRCVRFEFRGCNPSANTFIDERSCQRLCILATDVTPNLITTTTTLFTTSTTTTTTTTTTETPTVPVLSILEDKDTLRCPPPYKNPEDWPQICEVGSNTCEPHERCLKLSGAKSVCCVRPVTSSLRSLMSRMCGPRHTPMMAASGDPVRCHPQQRPCSPGQTCRFSTVLMIEICCMREEMLQAPMIGAPQEPLTTFVAGNSRVCEKDNEGSDCLPRLYPGDTGCVQREQCKGQSFCIKGMCLCRPGHVLFQKMCYWKCPAFYRNISGVCI